MKIACIGLGNIGYWIAGNVSKTHDTVVFNRTQSVAEKWVNEFGGTRAGSIGECVDGADAVLTCVSDDAALREVYFGESGVVESLAEDVLVIDHSTVSVSISREIAEAVSAKGGSFFDAPVSGGSIGAQNGVLAIMTGGDEAKLPEAEAVMDLYSSSIKYLGKSGAGQLAKMVNQIMTSSNVSALAEAMAFAKTAGLDQATTVDAIKNGAAGSWMLDNRSQFMIDGEFTPGFDANLMLKDIGLALDHAEQIGLDAPYLELAQRRYQALVDAGFGGEDMAGIYRVAGGLGT